MCERFVVHLGFGQYNVLQGERLNAKFLSKSAALKLAARKGKRHMNQMQRRQAGLAAHNTPPPLSAEMELVALSQFNDGDQTFNRGNTCNEVLESRNYEALWASGKVGFRYKGRHQHG